MSASASASTASYASIPGLPTAAAGLVPTHAVPTETDWMRKAGWSGSMPTEGEARILAVRVAFPDIVYDNGTPYEDGDTLGRLSDSIGRHLDGSITTGPADFPYESVYAYYLRSSYGRLRIAGEAYDYVAEHGRDFYADGIESLFREAFEALGDEIDFRDFDGDGDGTIDCAVMQFAGDTTSWATQWWPKTFKASNNTDAMRAATGGLDLGSLVLLHYPRSGIGTTQTFIHELGHAMGLPDYYYSPRSAAEATMHGAAKGGINTFDMMNDNSGDHNAFSKWMLGWLEDSFVISVTCDDEGNAVASDDTETGYRGHVRLRVERVSGGGISSPGTVVAIYPKGDDGSQGPLSDLILLEYDTGSGNNDLSWGTQTSPVPLGTGFRAFRVQATTKGGKDGRLVHDNKTDDAGDQLIEMLDPDGGTWHVSAPSFGLVGTHVSNEDGTAMHAVDRGGKYGCMLHVGDELTPETTPGTRFSGDDDGDGSGICLKVIREEDDYGLIDIWYE